jgi:hypothetical protein
VTTARLRLWLAILALALGAAAAIVRTPASAHPHTAASPLYKPASGC